MTSNDLQRYFSYCKHFEIRSFNIIHAVNDIDDQFLRATRSIESISYGNVSVCLSVCLGGWLVCLSQPVLYQNDKTYLKTFSTI